MHSFPALHIDEIRPTRDALHAYSQVLGDVLKAQRRRRKHWWHASLRPSLAGLTTGIIYGEVDCEIELNLRESVLSIHASTGEQTEVLLDGRPSNDLASDLSNALRSVAATDVDDLSGTSESYANYSPVTARKLAQALGTVSGAMVDFRASIREETSPIQVWPHHFDLSMLWLPGTQLPGTDPVDEENADKQMNFGFVFGDDGIDEPYFYVTAYPLPDELPTVKLPAGTSWRSEGFSGAVLLYKDLVARDDPTDYLLDLWADLYAAGRIHLANGDTPEYVQ